MRKIEQIFSILMQKALLRDTVVDNTNLGVEDLSLSPYYIISSPFEPE